MPKFKGHTIFELLRGKQLPVRVSQLHWNEGMYFEARYYDHDAKFYYGVYHTGRAVIKSARVGGWILFSDEICQDEGKELVWC